MEVWCIKAWITFNKEIRLRRVGARRKVIRGFPEACPNDRVVLEILPHARQVRYVFNSETGEFGSISDTGKHQNLRRLDGSGREHDLGGCFDRAYLAAPVEFDSCDRRAFNRELPDQGARQDGQIGL